jgi:hypothetical protein
MSTIATPEYVRAHNSPEAFDRMPEREQRALRLWVRLALAPAPNFAAEQGRWHSYNLKHHAEAALGWYVGNGEMKGAMLAEGYTEYRAWGSREHPDINWTFKVRRRCPHRMGMTVVGHYTSWHGRECAIRTYGFNCPGALWVPSMYGTRLSGEYPYVTATYPSLCQATPDAVPLFDRQRRAARGDGYAA